MHNYLYLIGISFVMGVFARMYMMKIDQKQYPTYPQGFISHVTLAIIAAALGALAIPSFAQKDYSAITFLTVAAQQFRDVRNIERQSLDNIEATEVIPRGSAYIEDIAKAFEARNYMAILVALVTSIAYYIFDAYANFSVLLSSVLCIIIGISTIGLLNKILSRQFINEIADIKIVPITFDGPLLKVNSTVIMNVALSQSKQRYLNEGIGIEIVPKEPHYSGILLNLGQRQAIIHTISVYVGTNIDVGEPEFVPLVRRNPQKNSLVIPVLPLIKDENLLLKAVSKTPVLESAKGKTSYLN